jgi:predicted enzyme related to lactoylglutathione lyase
MDWANALVPAMLAPAPEQDQRKERQENETMPYKQGQFAWYELMTTDLAGARAFYSQVVGWGTTDAQMPGVEYWMFTAGEQPVTGLMTLPEEARNMGTPPSWIGYVAVDDVDATASKITAAGGRIYQGPMDIPNVGRFAVFADPGGGVQAIFKSANPAQDPPFDMRAPGHVGWHELYAGDHTKAFTFYSNLFGWEKKDAMDMGPMGTYQIFGIGDEQIGGMMNKMPEMPVPFWTYYFNVGNIDEAAERLKAAGGQIMNGPIEVPGGGFVLQGMDPQGAGFALFGTR